MDSTKIFEKDTENLDVRERSATQFFAGDNMSPRNKGQRKLGLGEPRSTKQPNGYYKGSNYNGENKYGDNIFISTIKL